MRRKPFVAIFAIAFFCALPHICFAGVSLSPIDLEGHLTDPFLSSNAKAVVFVFVKTDCPISNRYAPEVKRLHAEFSRKGVLFWLVYPDSDLTPAAIRRHIADYEYPCPVLRDPYHRLVQLCRARVTPEAAVLTPQGQLIYHGRIDNRYVALGKSRPVPTRRDLEDAIVSVVEGDLTPSSEPAVGCTISPVE